MEQDELSEKFQQNLLLILRFSAFCCLFAWAWQHFLWTTPYQVVLAWGDQQITYLNRAIGLVFLVASLLSLKMKKDDAVMIIILAVSGLLLTLMFYCKYVQVGYALPNFIEHGGQMMTPLLLILALKWGLHSKATLVAIVLAFFMTFIGHGIYASGLYPTPDHFYALLEGSLGLSGQGAEIMIKTAGYLDFLICLGFFIKPLRKYCLAYAAFWGAITALARPVAGMSFDLSLWGADQFLQQAIWRAPHALIPFFLFYYFRVVEVEKGANVGKGFPLQTSSCTSNQGAPICNRH